MCIRDSDYSIWNHYDRIAVPVLCLRGADSDLVLPETIDQMQVRGPGQKGLLQVTEVAGCGHAPALNVPEQLDRIALFIEAANQTEAHA